MAPTRPVHRMLKLALVFVMVLAAACTRTETVPTTVTTAPQPSTTVATSPPTTQPLPVVELAADLREALLALGYTISNGGRAKTFFTGDYRSWNVSGELMSVWEYPDESRSSEGLGPVSLRFVAAGPRCLSCQC